MGLSDEMIRGFSMGLSCVIVIAIIACCLRCLKDAEESREEEIERNRVPVIVLGQRPPPQRPPPRRPPPQRAPLLPVLTHPLQPLPPREPAASTCFSYGLIAGNKECAICQNEFVEEDQCEMLVNCHHMYHHQCIKQWRAKGSHCPVCRAPMNGSSQLSQ